MPLRQATRACSTSSLVAGAPPWARPQAALWSMQSGQPTESHTVNRVMRFFAIVYAVEGIGQAKSGVIWQPLVHFLKQTQRWDAVQIRVWLAVVELPWIIKPLWGAISDFVPLFGYRR